MHEELAGAGHRTNCALGAHFFPCFWTEDIAISHVCWVSLRVLCELQSVGGKSRGKLSSSVLSPAKSGQKSFSPSENSAPLRHQQAWRGVGHPWADLRYPNGEARTGFAFLKIAFKLVMARC